MGTAWEGQSGDCSHVARDRQQGGQGRAEAAGAGRVSWDPSRNQRRARGAKASTLTGLGGWRGHGLPHPLVTAGQAWPCGSAPNAVNIFGIFKGLCPPSWFWKLCSLRRRMCRKGPYGRQEADPEEERLGGSAVSPSMAEGPGGGPGDYCCCPWHGWRLDRWGSQERGEGCPRRGQPTARCPLDPTARPLAFIAGLPRLQAPLQMTGHPGRGQTGSGARRGGGAGHRVPGPGP